MVPWLLAASVGLIVESITPDALCPPPELVRRAVQARIGSIELTEPWYLRYGIVHRQGADYVRLELGTNTEGAKIEREFASSGESCETLAQVMAVVVERQFRSFASEGEPEIAAAPASRDVSPTKPRGRDVETRRFRHSFELGGGLASDAIFRPTLRYVLELAPAFASLGLDWQPLSEHTTLGSGAAERTSGTVTLAAGPALQASSRLVARAGLQFAVRGERATTYGLPASSSGVRLVPSAGISTTLTLRVAGSLGVFIGGAAMAGIRPLISEFRVDSKEIFPIPLVVGGGELGLRLDL